MADLGDELRAARERRGMTQREAAAELDVTPNTVARWERGEVQPTTLHARRAIRRFLRRAPQNPV